MARKIIVGLGNPGTQYTNTFHNAGALFVDHYTSSLPVSKWSTLTHSRVLIYEDIAYALPTTFMNQSGIAVAELLAWFKIAPQDLIVIHDDTDQPLGTYKYVYDGGSGGHNGIKSITELLATPEYGRIKIGARPERFMQEPHIKAENFVLNTMHETEQAALYEAFGGVVKLIIKLIENDNPSGPDRISATGSVTPESVGSPSSALLKDKS